MYRLALLFILVLCQQSSFAAVYKCKSDSGKIEYQSTPCVNGTTISSKVIEPNSVASSTSSALTNTKRKCVGKELRINFTDMPLKATLQVLADFSGNKLAADPSVSGSGAFNYECIPWDSVLQDIASRHNLIVKIEGGVIHARGR